MPNISLYIPCFNAQRYLARTLEGVLRQTYPPNETLLIYDESGDGTLEIAARYPVEIIRQEGKGLAAARNTAFRNARHELVASLDADCVPEPDWLEKLVPLMDQPSVGAVGGRLTVTVHDSAADRWRQAHMPQDWGASRVLDPPFLFGSNTITRKSVAVEVGCYTEKLGTGGEDVDISKRIRAKGYHSIYEPTAQVRHIRQDTVRSVMSTFWRWHMAGIDRIKLRSVLGRALFIHFRANFLDFVKRDLRRKAYSLLWLDILLLFYMLRLDLRLYLRTMNSSAAAQPPPVCAQNQGSNAS